MKTPTYHKLMQVVDSTIHLEDYMNAENRATLEEKEYGTLGDLRSLRDDVRWQVQQLADAIDRLQREVEHINGKDAKIAALLDSAHSSLFTMMGLPEAKLPTVRRERFTADDEHNAAA